jgi:hypothetical protein
MDFDFRQAKPAKSVEEPSQPSQTETPVTQTFVTPEVMAAAGSSALKAAQRPEKQSLRDKIADSFQVHKKRWAISTAVVLLCGSITGFALVKANNRPTVAAAKPAVTVKKAAPKPTVIYSTLSGLPIADPAINQRVVTGVMIENSVQARPQSGLGQASVVFEAIAEGGITRFLALFQDTAPDNVGPIRSARPYYAQWALGFDAGYAHVGGSPEALQNIKDWGVRDLDQFHNGGSYHRIGTREAPHNVYTAISTLDQLEASKGFTSSTFTGFARKTADTPSKAPNAKTIDMAISGPLYNTHYDYNAQTNTYNRSEGGAPHIDANTNTQISPKVVIAMVMPYNLEADGYHSTYGTLGSGAAFIFQDGMVTQGTWTKADNKSQFTFTDAANKPIKLNPGQTWLTAVKASTNVTYAP